MWLLFYVRLIGVDLPPACKADMHGWRLTLCRLWVDEIANHDCDNIAIAGMAALLLARPCGK